MPPDDLALSLIDLIYDAAVDDTLWPKVLHGLVAATESQGASFWVLDNEERLKFPTFEYVNFDAGFIRDYLNVMADHDPTNQYLVLHPEQKIVQDANFITEAERDRHLYYDWHERNSDTRYRMVGMISPASSIRSGVALHRERAKGYFEPGEVEYFSFLFRHLGRALEIGFRLGSLGTLERATFDLLDRNPFALLLLDNHGRIILANRAACRIGETGDGIVISSQGISFLHASENRRLQLLIAAAIGSKCDRKNSPGGTMLASRPSGKRPFTVLVSPLSSGSFALTNMRPAACVVIADPDGEKVRPTEQLQALYGLTPAEARLAIRLALGDELKSAAEAMGIGYSTARTHLAAIFHKMETHRQGDLIKLLATTLPLLAP